MATVFQNWDKRLARVLLVDDDPASRLTLQTVLETCGYRVDTAASAAEAVSKLEDGEFALVLSDLNLESPEAGRAVLTHARMMPYKPATALITAYLDGAYHDGKLAPIQQKSLLIKPEDIPGLLSKVADLISERATRRMRRELRLAGV
jgi:CheY-like chemotaxis protein